MKVWLPFKTHKSKVFLIYPVNQCMKYLRFLNFIFFMVIFYVCENLLSASCQIYVKWGERGRAVPSVTCLSWSVRPRQRSWSHKQKKTLTFFISMNISNVTFETISFLYIFNFTDEEFFNLSSQDFQNFQPNLTELGKFGLSFSCSHY